jgi:hypothetical protein
MAPAGYRSVSLGTDAAIALDEMSAAVIGLAGRTLTRSQVVCVVAAIFTEQFEANPNPAQLRRAVRRAVHRIGA